MSIRCLFIVLLLASGSIALGQKNSTTGDENAIRQADREWSASSNIHDLDKVLSFYADDASVLPFNAPLVSGKDQIHQFFSQLMSKPGFALTFEPTQVHVAKAHDTAYEIGTAELKMDDPQGHNTTTAAKYVVVWRKRAATWKA